MSSNVNGRGAWRTTFLLLALFLVAGCSHLKWPWHQQPPSAPVPVHEVDVTGAGAQGVLQYWKRNTLLLDMRSVGSSGTLVVKPAGGTAWPVRLAFRVAPGGFAVLEVRGDQRVSLPINPTGTAPIDLELTPGVYTPKTAQLTVSWGPGAVLAP